MSIEFWLRYEAQVRPTRLAINFLLIIVRAERKVRLCVKLFDFFRGRILVRLTWNLTRFVPNSVEFITWNFRKKLLWVNFSEIFANQDYPLLKLVKFRPTFCSFILGLYCTEKFHTSTSICCLHPCKEARPQKNLKKEIRERKSRTFCFRKTCFVHSRSGTSYALLLGCFGQQFLLDVRHCVYWVLAKIWGPDSSHKIGNKFFINHCQGRKEGSFVCETVWYFSWANTRPFDLKFVAFCPKFNGDSYVEFQEKTISGEFFGNFVQTKAILYQNLWNFGLLSAIFILGPYCTEKFHTSTSICCLHPSKEARPQKNHKNEIRGRKSMTFFFSENLFCSLSVWDFLRLTPWVFRSEIFTRRSPLCLLSFGWDLRPTFVP